jgi:hypothetical protein
MEMSRRNVLATGSSALIAMAGSVPLIWAQSPAPQSETSPDLIVHNAKVTTLQSGRPEAEAFAVRGEKIVAVGGDGEIMRLRTNDTRIIDAGGRRRRGWQAYARRPRRNDFGGQKQVLSPAQLQALLGYGPLDEDDCGSIKGIPLPRPSNLHSGIGATTTPYYLFYQGGERPRADPHLKRAQESGQ